MAEVKNDENVARKIAPTRPVASPAAVAIPAAAVTATHLAAIATPTAVKSLQTDTAPAGARNNQNQRRTEMRAGRYRGRRLNPYERALREKAEFYVAEAMKFMKNRKSELQNRDNKFE